MRAALILSWFYDIARPLNPELIGFWQGALFSVSPRAAGDDPDQWMCSVGRHWSLDRPDPR